MQFPFRFARRCENLPLAFLVLLALLALLGLRPAPARAADAKDIKWTVGPAKVSLGSIATIDLPKGYSFTDSTGAAIFMEITHNPPSTIMGLIVPSNDDVKNDDDFWFMTFSFDAVGYVKDEDKGAISGSGADSILDSLREATRKQNEERTRRGWPDLNLIGWFQPPFYDNDTHNITWATRFSSEGKEGVNYDSRVLGRRGVMQVKLVASPEKIAGIKPTYNKLVGNIAFVAGETYNEFRSGDKIAEYGLVTLITGGAAVAVFKFWKPLMAAGAFLLAGIGAAFRKIKNFFSPGSASAARRNATVPAAAPAAANTVITCPGCGTVNRVSATRTGAVCGNCSRILN